MWALDTLLLFTVYGDFDFFFDYAAARADRHGVDFFFDCAAARTAVTIHSETEAGQVM